MTEAYGQRLGEALRVENGPAIVTRALRTADIAVTEIRCDNPLREKRGPIPREDAFLVSLHLRDSRNREYWEDGRRVSVCDLRAGESCLHDLKRDPTAFPDKAFRSLIFYLPRAALDAIADDANASRICDLSYEPGAGVNDVTISGLGGLLLPALSHPDQANSLFVDHVLLAVGVHIAQTYGGMRPMSRLARGGLAPWQERRAREILRANIRRGVALEEVARAPFLRDDLRLDASLVRQLSPAVLPLHNDVPLLLAVGALETAEFHRQSQLIASHWPLACRAPLLDLPGCNHFTACEALAAPGSTLFQRVCSILDALPALPVHPNV